MYIDDVEPLCGRLETNISIEKMLFKTKEQFGFDGWGGMWFVFSKSEGKN